jgi:hypothetical protein
LDSSALDGDTWSFRFFLNTATAVSVQTRIVCIRVTP